MQNENEILWTAAFLNERFTSIVSPLGWSFIGSSFEQLALRDPLRYMGYPEAEKIPATRLWHGHPYVNAEIFSIFYKPFPDAFLPADAVRYFPNGNLAERKRAPYPRSMFQPRFLASLFYHLSRDPLVTSPLNFIAWARFTHYHNRKIRELQARLQAATNAQQVLGVIEDAYKLDADLLHIHRWSLTYADMFYRLLAYWTGDYAQTLMSRVPNKTREVNEALAALGQASPPLTAELLKKMDAGDGLTLSEQKTADAVERFLANHGHRSFSLDFAQPTFRDDPTQLLLLLSSSELIPASPPETEHGVVLKAKLAMLRPSIAFARRYAQLREDQRYYWQKGLAVVRSAYLMLGRDLAARDLIADAPSIFYATRQEIAEYYGMELQPAELAEKIAARKREWQSFAELERARGQDAYPHFLRGDTPLHEQRKNLTEQLEWHGRGVSAGTVRGIARIVHEPRGLGRVGEGEILIAPSTDPAWTPVFGRLRGLVMERGGVLSHGAVVAREYHLPAVTAIAHLTHILHDGDWIEVDGTSGIVRRLESPDFLPGSK